MKRTFIAVKIDVDENFKESIYSLREELVSENIKWIESKNLHITLVFIGNTDETAIMNIKDLLQSKLSCFGKIGFALKGFGVFRNFKDPRIIYADVENPEHLIEVFSIVRKGLEELNIKIEERDFKPHLTIGRIKYLKDRNSLQEIIGKYRDIKFQEVEVSEIVYYESIFLTHETVYKPISKVKL